MPSLNSYKNTFTGNDDAKKPVSICLNMWQVFLPTGGGILFPKKTLTNVDTKVDVDLRPGEMILITSEGPINGTTACQALPFSRPGTEGLYRITVPVFNYNAANHETANAGALLATIIIMPTIEMLYNYNGTF